MRRGRTDRVMSSRLWHSTSAWSFANTAALAGYGLVVLPFQARLLSPDAMGVWYAFLAMGSLAIMVCNGGITPTVQRFASYLHAGATRLQADGVPPSASAAPNWVGVAAYGASVDRLFRLLALGGMALLALIGFSFIALKVTDLALRQQALYGWTIQVLAIGVLIPAAGRTALVQGAGGMLTSQRRLLIARLAAPGVVVTGLCLDLGVISLGLGTLTMAVVQWLGHRRCLPVAISAAPPPGAWPEHLRAMWPTTWRFTLVTLGAWMITLSGTLILGTWVGLSEAGQYGLSLQVLQLCTTVAAVWMSAAIPRLCALRAAGEAGALRRLFTSRWTLGLITFVVLATPAVIFGQHILGIIGTNTRLLEPAMLIAMAVILLLELNHGPLCASFLMTGNQVPFVPAALASGVAIVLGGIALSVGAGLGVWSVIIAQGVVQLMYNNWRWPTLAFAQVFRRTHGVA